jgi:hypothetical protein
MSMRDYIDLTKQLNEEKPPRWQILTELFDDPEHDLFTQKYRMDYNNKGGGKHLYSSSGDTSHSSIAGQLGSIGYKQSGQTAGRNGATKTTYDHPTRGNMTVNHTDDAVDYVAHQHPVRQ